MSNETRNAKSVRPTDLDFCLKAYHDTKLKAHSIRREAQNDLLNAIVLEIKALKEMRAGIKATDTAAQVVDALMASQKPSEATIDDPAPKKRGRPAKVPELANG